MTPREKRLLVAILREWSARLRTTPVSDPSVLIANIAREMDEQADELAKVTS